MTHAPVRERRVVAVRGIVQGVGFRPFIHSLARRHGLSGSVHNDAAGVHIEIEGDPESLDRLLRDITEKAPPLALVEAMTWERLPVRGDREFRIEESRVGTAHQALVSPDVATCVDCLRELLDPANRRYRYPFVNCTNCGPRFSITRSVPYDRAMTTMVAFTMCTKCRREFDDPEDRRFHAQPNACPVCGPRVQLVDRWGNAPAPSGTDPIAIAAELLRGGAIIAIKGLGGYHLACDPLNQEAVRTLRRRKVRGDKPFALMAGDIEQIRTFCKVGPEEMELLTSPARPIVPLTRRPGTEIAEEIAPRQRTLGVMLPYTPLHHLLLHDAKGPLVMTSGNRSDEPIAYRDSEVFEQLGDIADHFLTHDRPIHLRGDDSVVRIAEGQPYQVRRSRGYAPLPLTVETGFAGHTLACGGELKNTFCVARANHAFLSHHIGDLENYETLQSFSEGIDHFCKLFDVRPQLVAYDLHPEYLSTKYAGELEEAGMTVIGVQHHHAHIASCLADNSRPASERVVGVAMDGTGYGTDGAIWGGEFFEGSIREGFARRAYLEYMPLPGGEAAIREPWRMAVAQLLTLFSEDEVLALPLDVVRNAGARNVRLIHGLMLSSINTPMTSSAGRLFDAVSALVGVPGTARATYEGQAAIELEQAAGEPAVAPYPFRLLPEGDGWVVATRGIIAGVVDDLLRAVPASEVSARFHRTMVEVVVAACAAIRQERQTTAVALSGGTFQNMLLVEGVASRLKEEGYRVYLHRRVPANDGGLSLGQAVLADSVFRQYIG